MGIYKAYYYSGRFQYTFDLAEQTINNETFPSLPETWYWGGQAALMLGDKENAVKYFNKALEFYPNWDLASQGLAEAQS